jgi:hypothetical protein
LGANDYSNAYDPSTGKAGFVAMDYYVNGPIKTAFLKIIDALVAQNPAIKIFIADGFPSVGTDISNQIHFSKFFA